jgi:chitinase
MVSIGGWTGSRFFSTSIGSAENRTAFVKTCLDFVSEYDLDGLDFEYVFPDPTIALRRSVLLKIENKPPIY